MGITENFTLEYLQNRDVSKLAPALKVLYINIVNQLVDITDELDFTTAEEISARIEGEKKRYIIRAPEGTPQGLLDLHKLKSCKQIMYEVYKFDEEKGGSGLSGSSDQNTPPVRVDSLDQKQRECMTAFEKETLETLYKLGYPLLLGGYGFSPIDMDAFASFDHDLNNVLITDVLMLDLERVRSHLRSFSCEPQLAPMDLFELPYLVEGEERPLLYCSNVATSMNQEALTHMMNAVLKAKIPLYVEKCAVGSAPSAYPVHIVEAFRGYPNMRGNYVYNCLMEECPEGVEEVVSVMERSVSAVIMLKHISVLSHLAHMERICESEGYTPFILEKKMTLPTRMKKDDELRTYGVGHIMHSPLTTFCMEEDSNDIFQTLYFAAIPKGEDIEQLVSSLGGKVTNRKELKKYFLNNFHKAMVAVDVSSLDGVQFESELYRQVSEKSITDINKVTTLARILDRFEEAKNKTLEEVDLPSASELKKLYAQMEELYKSSPVL